MKRTFNGLLLCALVVAGDAAAQTYSKTETIEYHDDLTYWVIGQVKRATTNGVETGRTEYGLKALPSKTYRFGKLQQTLTYNADGTLATVSDGRDGVSGAETTITLSSWKRGIPQSIKYPATPESPSGATQSAVVNDDGTIASVTDENGYKTCYGYDAMGRLASITYPSESVAGVCDTSTWAQTTQSFQQIASTEYGLSASHWKQTVSTGNARKVTYFDAMWRPVVEESFDNTNVTGTRSIAVKRYDTKGRLAFQSYPMASLSGYASTALTGSRTTYDALDRVTRVEQDSELDVLSTTTDYLSNASGPYTRVTNPRGQSTRTWFQMFDQPDYGKPVMIWHPEDAYTHISRDPFGKPTRLRRSNSSSPTGGTVAVNRDYTYNTYQELCRTDEPETGSSFMGYDAAGNLLWSASGYTTAASGCVAASSVAARRVDRIYDARNQVRTLLFPDGLGNQSWTYTSDGLVESITTDNSAGGLQVVNSYSYNKRRLLASESVQQPGWYTWAINYGYSANGHFARIRHPGGELIDYAPNALGQATQAVSPYGNYATNVSYHPNGAIKQFTYGNGIVHTLTQNARGLPDTSKDAYGATSFLNDGYDYDANGNVAAISDGASGTAQRGNRTMTYDGLDRLKAVASPMYGAAGASYTYDAFDNLTRVKVGGAAARDHYYCYDANWRLTNVKTGSCTGASVIGLGYDVQGNLENKNGVAFAFDYGNRLRSAAGSETYRYDGHGRRVSAILTGAGSIVSQYGQDGVLRFQSDNRRKKVFNHVYLGGSLIASRETPSGTTDHFIKYQHTDALGSPVVVTDANRVVLERNEYEPYGKVIAPASPQDGPGYTGHVFDAATGLNYMQQRYYDPSIGRFLSVDPVTADSATGANFNRYWYANNNPYKFTDPDGRRSFLVSRPLDAKVLGVDVGKRAGNHNFIVHHAERPGDSSDTVRVRSYGITSDGTMGEVNSNTEGRNANTSAQDRAAWESLGDEGSNVTFREINASDEVVQGIADSVSSAFNYSYVPEASGGFNSNTAAGAIAQEADGGSASVDNGRRQPGTSQERISTAREQVLHKPIQDK